MEVAVQISIEVLCDSKLLSGFPWYIYFNRKEQNKTAYPMWKKVLIGNVVLAAFCSIDSMGRKFLSYTFIFCDKIYYISGLKTIGHKNPENLE
jgi:hypothetical protein